MLILCDMPTLYIVATPIGNLQDITLRALETLKRVSVVYAEDTRVTRKLLDRYEIAIPVRSYHQHSGIRVIREIGEAMEKGDVALVTDAGTPGIADPGNELVDALLCHCERSEAISGGLPRRPDEVGTPRNDIIIKVVPIPGASAVTAAASISGFNMSRFAFMGYVPKKKGRKKFFTEVAQSEIPVILYETPHRIVKTLEELGTYVRALIPDNFIRRRDQATAYALPPQKLRGFVPEFGEMGAQLKGERGRKVVACRELTKQFESIYRGTIEEVLEQVKKDPVKGEYVIVVDKSVKS